MFPHIWPLLSPMLGPPAHSPRTARVLVQCGQQHLYPYPDLQVCVCVCVSACVFLCVCACVCMRVQIFAIKGNTATIQVQLSHNSEYKLMIRTHPRLLPPQASHTALSTPPLKMSVTEQRRGRSTRREGGSIRSISSNRVLPLYHFSSSSVRGWWTRFSPLRPLHGT